MNGRVVGLGRLRGTVICLVVLAVVSSGFWAPASGLGGSESAAGGRTADSDNSFATANAASSGVLYNGSVNSTDDVSDYYSISALSGQTISAMATFTCATRDLAVVIYDPNQNQITGGYSGFPTRGDVFIAVINGTYYVEVTIQSRPGDDNYTLNITVEYPRIVNHGDTINASVNGSSYNRLTWYRTWLDGNISGSGKSEAVIVNMTEGTGVTNYNLAFVDILEFAAMNTYNSSWSHSPSESVGGAASYTGWYYIIAYGQPGSGAGNVTLTIQKFQASSDGNNDWRNATATKHNAVVTAHLDQGFDHYDWYRYHVFNTDTLRVRVDRTTGTDVLVLAVFEDDMTPVDITDNIDPASGNVLAYASLDIPAAASDRYYRVFVSADLAVRSGAQSDETAAFDYKVTFTSTNHKPAVQSSLPDVSMDEDTGYSFNLSSHYSDIDGDTVLFNFTGLTNVQPTYTEANGTLTLVPKANWFGKETLSVQADDYYGGTVMLPSNITVNSVNDLPYVKKSVTDVKMLQGGIDSSIDLSKVFADADIAPPGIDRLTYTVEDNGSVWVEIQANGAVRLTAPRSFFGSQSMTFVATDQEGATARAPCNVTVTHVNQPPHVNVRPANLSVNEDDTATIDLSTAFTDPEEDPITITPSDMTRINVGVDPNTHKATLKPLKDMSGFYEDIKFTAQDDMGAIGDFVVVRVTVVAVNDPPVFKTLAPATDVTIIELGSQEFGGSATDVDDATLNLTWYLDGKDMRISETTYTYITNYESAGNHTVKLVVDDGQAEITRVWNVTVVNLNRPPSDVKIVSPKTGETFAQAAEIEFDGSGKDLDKDALTYTWMDGRSELSTEKTFTTSSLKPGNHNIYLEVFDGVDAVKSKNILITIVANAPPKILGFTPATGQEFTTGQRIAFSVNYRNDETTDNLTFVWSENNGANVLSNSQSFETKTLKAGTHTIIVSVNDGFNTVNGSVTVEVANPAPAPGMSMRTLGIMGGIVAAVAIIGALAFVMMRRRKPPVPDSSAQAGQVAQPQTGAAATQLPPYQPYPSGYQQPPPPPDYGGGYQQPAQPPGYSGGYQQPPQQYDPGQYQPPAAGDPGVPPAEAYQQQPAWAMAPPSEPGGGDAVRPAEPAPEQPPATEARQPEEPQQQQ